MSAGSGVVIDAARGHILTNHHVVGNADHISVTIQDGRRFTAKLLGRDEATDLALLQVDASDLTALPLSDSDQLRVGDVVLAIGNPFGLGQTVTSGIISALGRSGLAAEGFENFIQTDAPINPGNSGGALINTKGELIGVNTAIIAPAGGNVGIGFAVPVNMARAVVHQILKYGEVRRGRIGITVQTLTPDIAQALNVPLARGAVIGSIDKGSPAEMGGLQPSDIIIEIDGRPVSDANDVRNRIGLRERGSRVDITYWRGGRNATASLTVAEPKPAAADIGRSIVQLNGAQFGDLPPDHPAARKIKGVLVVSVETGSPAWRVGLRSGDVLFAINQRAVTSTEELAEMAKQPSGTLALSVLRGDAQLLIIAQG